MQVEEVSHREQGDGELCKQVRVGWANGTSSAGRGKGKGCCHDYHAAQEEIGPQAPLQVIRDIIRHQVLLNKAHVCWESLLGKSYVW